MDNAGRTYKRKNEEVVPGSHHHLVNGSTSSSSSSLGVPLNSGPQQSDEPSVPGVGVLDTLTCTPSEYSGGSEVLSSTEGSQRTVTSRSNAISQRMDSALAYQHYHPLQGNYMSRPFQPGSNAWVEQFRNHGGNAVNSNWNYAPPMPYLYGRSVSGGVIEIETMSAHGYQGTMSSSDSAILLHPSIHQHHNRPPPHMLGMRAPNSSFHPQFPGPSYRNPMNSHINSSRDGLHPRYFPASGEWIYRPHQRISQSAPEEMNGQMRLLPSEDVAIRDYYGDENFIDQHRDMRLDIDDMSYEELLALEERIGEVKTGLSEETISECLGTRMHASCTTSSSLDESAEILLENSTCIICQVHYEENEEIGILKCGHDYHADCIKEWLLLKNVCPICKTSALPEANKDQ